VNPISLLHVSDGLLVERPNLVVARLSTSVEVLASKLGEPDREIESVVPELEVGLELREGSVIPMKGHEVESASTIAGFQHVLDPGQPIRGRSGGWTAELVALVPEGLDVGGPEVGTVLSSHVRLTGLIGFVHTQDVAGVTLDNLLLEIVDLVVTPKLRNSSKTEVLGQSRDIRAPGVQESLAIRLEQAETRVSAKSPGNTELATSSRDTITTGGGWGRACRGSSAGGRLVRRRRSRRGGARRGRSGLRGGRRLDRGR